MTGKFISYELMTTDHEAAIAFYGAVVGWTASDFGGFYVHVEGIDAEAAGRSP